MKKSIPILFLGIILSTIIYVSCKKEVIKVIPTIKILTVTNITANSASSGGEVTADGGAPVTARGMCWSLNQNPTTVDTKTSNGSGIGSFTSSITDLTPGTTYYIKAYAINSVGTSYSSQSTFTTLALAPVLTTTDLTAVTSTSANSGGNISNDGGSPVTARGVCWSTTQNPTIADSKTTDGTGMGVFTSSITGLTPGATYYIRAYATNSIGTAYGNQISTTTTAILPTVATTSVTDIASTTAIGGGNVTNDGGASVTSRGVCWSTSQNPTIDDSKTTDGTGIGVFTSSITGLTPGATYYIRAYATNSIGTAYGNQITITTLAILPTITTTAVTAITSATATSGGNITNDGGASVTSRGVCWNTSQNPTTADNKTSNSTGTGVFTSSLTGLTPGTTYYVRAYATNSQGTAYGNIISFTTQNNEIIFNPNLTYGTITDVDGNVYKTIIIGTQTWMAENLKTTKYKDNTPIPFVTDNTVWSNLISPGYSWYNNNAETFKDTYGALYNWYTVNTGNLCPAGWHVHTEAEWTILTNYLGGKSIAGGKLKEPGTSHWSNPNTGATNETGFTALPGGTRFTDGSFGFIGNYGFWWFSSDYSIEHSWNMAMMYDNSNVASTDINRKRDGFSVRCLKDDGQTLPLPTVTTSSITSITQTTAIGGGNVTTDGGATVTSRGVCWSTSSSPTITNSKSIDGNGIGSFTSNLSGLTANTLYYVRAYATNSQGTAYGNQLSFLTTAGVTGTFTDSRDGKIYKTVNIGSQAWMAENLAYLPVVSPASHGDTQMQPYYYVYGYEGNSVSTAKATSNFATYGVLYNWFAAKTACPSDWYLPTHEDWRRLANYFGGEDPAGGKLKEAGEAHWLSPNIGATNSTGFTALPGGMRGENGQFGGLGYSGYFWSSSVYSLYAAWYRWLYYRNATLYPEYFYSKDVGFSVRCIKYLY